MNGKVKEDHSSMLECRSSSIPKSHAVSTLSLSLLFLLLLVRNSTKQRDLLQ
jgi:hypothetical protein